MVVKMHIAHFIYQNHRHIQTHGQLDVYVYMCTRGTCSIHAFYSPVSGSIDYESGCWKLIFSVVFALFSLAVTE